MKIENDIEIKPQIIKPPNMKETKVFVKPKRPTPPFFIFSKEKKQILREKFPEKTPTEIGETLGDLWNALDEREKEPYLKIYNQEKL